MFFSILMIAIAVVLAITFSSYKIIATFIFICIYKHRNLSMNVFFASIDNFNIRLLPSAGPYTCGRADQTWRA